MAALFGSSVVGEGTTRLIDRPPADPWRRLMARLIDIATVGTVLWTLVVLQVFWFMDPLSSRFDPQPWGRGFVATVFFVVIFAGYEVVFLVGSKGQTPGKDIMKIRVVPLDGTNAVTIGRAVRRWVVPGLVPLLYPLWIAGAVLAAIGLSVTWGARRSIPDLLAGTTVVPFNRDQEDPLAKRPMARHIRRRLARDEDGDNNSDEERSRR